MGTGNRRNVVAVVAATALAFLYAGGAFATHPFTILAVRDVQAYRHVLETDDRLLLIRYAMKDSPAPTGSAYNNDAAILFAFDAGLILRESNPPRAGYGLAAMYWEPSASSTVVWGSTDTQVCIDGDPTLFLVPQRHCNQMANTVGWNGADDLDRTAGLLATDLRTMLLDLERDDPDVDPSDYVTAAGITPAGQLIVESAFPWLTRVASPAFTFFQGSASADFDPVTAPAGSLTAQVASSTSAFALGLTEIGQRLGLGALASGMLFIVIVVTGLYAGIRRLDGDPVVIRGLIGPLLIFAALQDFIPFPAAIAGIAGAGVLGLAAASQRILPS